MSDEWDRDRKDEPQARDESPIDASDTRPMDEPPEEVKRLLDALEYTPSAVRKLAPPEVWTRLSARAAAMAADARNALLFWDDPRLTRYAEDSEELRDLALLHKLARHSSRPPPPSK